MEYLFPIDKINKKDKCAIWGGGDAGRKLFEWNKRFQYCDIVVIFDKDLELEFPYDVKVDKVDNWENYNFEKIIITMTRNIEQIKDIIKKIKLPIEKCVFLAEEEYYIDHSYKDVCGNFDEQEIRDEWVKGRLQKIEAGKTLIDAGAGEMRYAQYCKHLNYIAQDFAEYAPNKVSEGLQPEVWDTRDINIKCDIIDMPLSNDSVDVILCTEVFEHLKNPILAVKEFSRILRPDGKLLLTAPFCSITHFAPYYYANGFSKYWYTDILKDYGFEVEAITPYGNYFTWLWQEINRVKYVSQRYCDYKIKEDELFSLFDSMKLLNRLSKIDTGSDELLCAGHMVEARKAGYKHDSY